MGFHVAWMIHIYLYAASRLWDTDRISRLRRLPLKRRAITHFGEEPSAASGKIGRAGPWRGRWSNSIGRPFGGQSTSHYSSDRRENRNTCFLTMVSGRVVGNPSLIGLWKSSP